MNNIDWSKMITAEMKAEQAAASALAAAKAELARLRAIADDAVSPLQDAVDLEMATDEETALLTAWKRYRVELSRVPSQEGYPASIEWPTAPA